MNHPLITEQDIHNGEELARIDGNKYHAVQVVYKVNGVGAPSFYCHLSEWPKTDAGRIAALQDEVERLRAEILMLKSAPITVEDALEITAPPMGLICPHCGAGPFQRVQGRAALYAQHG